MTKNDSEPSRNLPADLLVVQPDASDPLDRFAGWLADCGVAVRVIRPYEGNAVPHVLVEAGLLVLGGAMSSNDDADYPWLEDIRILLRYAEARHRPTLGICLGAQLLSQALGGKVISGQGGVEAGVVDVRLREAAMQDALFSGLEKAFPMCAMHGDTIVDLPSNAEWLADTVAYPHQAFRAGGCAWGVQFHPEISPLTYQGWARDFRSQSVEDMRRVERGLFEFPQRDAVVVEAAKAIAHRFAEIVHGSAEQSTEAASLKA